MTRNSLMGLTVLSALIATVLPSTEARAHCEVPCGIYGDSLRISLLKEHADTIEKSMRKIDALQKKKTKNYNQIVRWITTKEDHANKVQHIVSQYFLTQRIKPEQKTYAKRLEVLHQLLVVAMKCKQSIDLDNVKELRALIDQFDKLYFAK